MVEYAILFSLLDHFLNHTATYYTVSFCDGLDVVVVDEKQLDRSAEVGEEVSCPWTNGQKYPGIVSTKGKIISQRSSSCRFS